MSDQECNNVFDCLITKSLLYQSNLETALSVVSIANGTIALYYYP